MTFKNTVESVENYRHVCQCLLLHTVNLIIWFSNYGNICVILAHCLMMPLAYILRYYKYNIMNIRAIFFFQKCFSSSKRERRLTQMFCCDCSV